jgi:hypothetical protein
LAATLHRRAAKAARPDLLGAVVPIAVPPTVDLDSVGALLEAVVRLAAEQGVDAEQALRRRALALHESLAGIPRRP